jgi:hypothetical protein
MPQGEGEMTADLIEALIMRKQRYFGENPRSITNECVVVKNGECVVRAEARMDL